MELNYIGHHEEKKKRNKVYKMKDVFITTKDKNKPITKEIKEESKKKNNKINLNLNKKKLY